jgi:hypothetical protein
VSWSCHKCGEQLSLSRFSGGFKLTCPKGCRDHVYTTANTGGLQHDGTSRKGDSGSIGTEMRAMRQAHPTSSL